MKSIVINNRLSSPPPTGNPFPLYPSADYLCKSDRTITIPTFLSLDLPDDVGLVIESKMENLIVTGWKIEPKSGLYVVVHCPVTSMSVQLEKKIPFAEVRLIEQTTAKVRFIEMAGGGGRIMRGNNKVAEGISVEEWPMKPKNNGETSEDSSQT